MMIRKGAVFAHQIYPSRVDRHGSTYCASRCFRSLEAGEQNRSGDQPVFSAIRRTKLPTFALRIAKHPKSEPEGAT